MSTSTSPDPVSEPLRGTATAPAPAVLVVESDGWLASRLCDLLQTEPGFRLAGAAAGTEEAMSMAQRDRFDIAVVGHQPPAESGFRLCRELKRTPDPPSVVICCPDPDGVLAACSALADADAVISRYHAGAELPGVLDRVDAPEHAVYALLLAGLPASEVASALRMSETELELRRLALLDELETLSAARGTGY